MPNGLNTAINVSSTEYSFMEIQSHKIIGTVMEKLQPHNKHVVTFNIDIEYSNSTMAKTSRNSTEVPAKDAAKEERIHRISGFKPFLYDAEYWDTTAPSQILKRRPKMETNLTIKCIYCRVMKHLNN